MLSLYLPNMWVKYVLKKNNKFLSDMPFTGNELGIKILKEQKITDVSIESIELIDQYNPEQKKILIAEDKINKKSIYYL